MKLLQWSIAGSVFLVLGATAIKLFNYGCRKYICNTVQVSCSDNGFNLHTRAKYLESV